MPGSGSAANRSARSLLTRAAAPYLVLPAHAAEALERLGADAQLVVEQAAVVTPGIDATSGTAARTSISSSTPACLTTGRH